MLDVDKLLVAALCGLFLHLADLCHNVVERLYNVVAQLLPIVYLNEELMW